MAAETVNTISLSKDAGGVYRLGETRVTLDLVIGTANRGVTPEQIVQTPALW